VGVFGGTVSDEVPHGERGEAGYMDMAEDEDGDVGDELLFVVEWECIMCIIGCGRRSF
jgi:hypothetical protein